MKTKILILCLMLSTVPCNYAADGSQSENKSYPNSENTIIFNGWYHSGKEKWQGTHHNKLLFTWFTASTTAANRQEYRKLIDHQRKNGVKFIGYYYSSTTSPPPEPVGHHGRFPECGIPPEAVKYSWILRDPNGQPITWYGQKDRYFLNIGLKKVQDAILSRAIGNAKQLGANVLYLDNWNYKSFAPAGQTIEQWAEKNLALLVRARELTHQYNLKLVVNQASPLQYWPEFAPYLDGIAYEIAVHPNRLKMQSLYEIELSSYEKVLAMNKSIFIYTYTHPGSTKKEWDPDGRKAATTAMLVMPKSQSYWGGIYVCPPRYEVWPVGGWMMWPEQLGKPLGPRKWNGNTVTRKFEHGSISVTVGKDPKFNISFEY